MVYKIVHHREGADELRSEFEALHVVQAHCNADRPRVFAIPRALAFFNPLNEEFFTFPESNAQLRQNLVPVLAADSFRNIGISLPTYTMDRVHAIPAGVGTLIRSEYYPRRAQAYTVPYPSLCRLYFGKQLQNTGTFVNSNNFPIDVARYQAILDSKGDSVPFLSVEEIATGMGKILGRIHWTCGYDGRDIEFVMGGDGYSGVSYHVIDFNQVSAFIPEDNLYKFTIVR